MAKRTQRRRTSRDNAKNYAAAAEQFREAGQMAKELEYWNAAGLLFVHAAIAFADAVSIYMAEWKSTSPNHMDAVALLKEVTSGKKGRDRAAKHFKDVIEEKNRASYEGDTYHAKDVDRLEVHLDRFRTWCRGLLGEVAA